MVEQTRCFSRRSFARVSGLMSLGLLAACAPSAQPTPTAAPKPTAAATPTAPRAESVERTAPKPAAAPTQPAAKAAPSPVAKSFAPAAVSVVIPETAKTKSLSEVADKQGLYKQFGLTATTAFVSDGNKAVAALVSGSADIAPNMGPSPIFLAVGRGVGLKIVAGATRKPNYLVYASDPAVKTLKDLEGKSVGIGAPGALLHALMVAMLKKHDVDMSKVTFVNIGTSAGADIYRAIATRKVDAGTAELDFRPETAKDAVTVIAEVWTELPGFIHTAIVSSDQAIREKRDVLVRTLAAWGQTFRFMHKPESQDLYLAAMKSYGATETQARSSWQFHVDHKAYAADLVLTEQELTYMQQMNVDAGAQDTVVPFDKVADMSLARDALKLMGAS